MVRKAAKNPFKANIPVLTGKVSNVIIGTEKKVAGRHQKPLILTGKQLHDLTRGELEKKFEDAGYDPYALHKDADKFFVKPDHNAGEKDALAAGLQALAAKMEWDYSYFDRFRKSGVLFKATKATIDENFIKKNIYLETRNPEVAAIADLNRVAHENLMKAPYKEVERKLEGISPETRWLPSLKKRYHGIEGVKEWLSKKNMSVKRTGYENDKVNMALNAFLTKEEAEKAVSPHLPTQKQSFLTKRAAIKPPYDTEAMKNLRMHETLESKIQKLDTPQNMIIISAYADTYLNGSRNGKEILRHAAKHPKNYADVAQLVLKSDKGRGISTTTAERNVKIVTGLNMGLNLEKREKMAELGPKELKRQFIRSLGDTLNISQASQNKPLIKYALAEATDAEIEAVARDQMSADEFIKSHPLDINKLYNMTRKKPQPRNYEKWEIAGGDVINAPSGGGGGAGSDKAETTSMGRGRPSGGGTAKREGKVIRSSRGRLVGGGRPWLSRREAVEKPSGGYEFVTRRGSVPAKLGFMTAEERKEEWKENKTEVKKIEENLKKSGLSLTANERNRLAKMSEGRREKKLETMIAKKEEKRERLGKKYSRYKGAVGEEEAKRLTMPKKDEGYGFLTKWWRTRRAERMRTDEAYRQKVIAKQTEKEGTYRYQAIKASRIASEKERIAASKWWTGFAKMSQTTKWALIIVCAIAILFLPIGLFYCVGWAIAVALVALVQLIVWVFISVWFALAQGAVSVIGAIGQLFIGAINGLLNALLGWMGQPYQPFNWQWVQNMPMFSRDANGNWVLVTYTDANGVRHTLTWGALNLVPPSFLKLDSFMPRVFDTDPLIAKILPILSNGFNWFYGPIAQMYTNWIATAQWWQIGIVVGMPVLITIFIVAGIIAYYRLKIKPRMY